MVKDKFPNHTDTVDLVCSDSINTKKGTNKNNIVVDKQDIDWEFLNENDDSKLFNRDKMIKDKNKIKIDFLNKCINANT